LNTLPIPFSVQIDTKNGDAGTLHFDLISRWRGLDSDHKTLGAAQHLALAGRVRNSFLIRPAGSPAV
jgi:hypothetical protein